MRTDLHSRNKAHSAWRGGIYIGWVGYANLGDEAMWQVCRDVFPSLRWSTYADLSYTCTPAATTISSVTDASTGSSKWLRVLREEFLTQRRLRMLRDQTVHRLATRLGGEVAMLGGGTLINDKGMLDQYESARLRTGRLVPVFGTGVRDPDLWSSDPNWRDERQAWVDALAELPIVGVRGPRSKQLLEEAGARNVVVSGDPAVMLHRPLTQNAPPSDGPLRIAMNCGLSCTNWGGVKIEAINKEMAKVAWALALLGHQVDIVPVWPEDVAICAQVASDAAHKRVRALPVVTSAAPYLKLIGRYDIAITFKLHAGILAAAANVPFVMVNYEPKCRDFAESIGWEQLTIRSDQAQSREVLRLVDRISSALPQHREKLSANMAALRRTFQIYCETIGQILSDPEAIGPRTRISLAPEEPTVA